MRAIARPARRSLTRIGLVIATALAAACVAVPAAQAESTPVFYPLPSATQMTAGEGIVVDPEGNVWFTANDNQTVVNQIPRPPIGKFVPAQMTAGTSDGLTVYRTPTYATPSCCATFTRSLAFDNSAGRLWWVRSDGLFGFANTAALVPGTDQGFSSARITGGVALYGVAVDQTTHAVWIAESGSSNVQTPPGSGYFPGGRIFRTDTGLGASEGPNIAQQAGETTLNSQRYDAKPRGVSVDAQGKAWFAEAEAGLPGYRIASTTGASYTEYLLPCHGPPGCSGVSSGTGPVDTAVAPDGSVWFINQLLNTVGRLDTVGGTITEYAITSIDPTLAAGKPRQIRFASDGTLWLVQSSSPYINTQANAIVRIVPDAVAPTGTVYKTGTNSPFAIAPSVTGDVWFTASTTTTSGVIGRLEGVIAGGQAPMPTATPTPTPGPGATPTPTPLATLPPVPPVASTPGVVLKPVSIGVAAPAKYQVQSDSLSANQICVGPPQDKCSLIFLLDTREYVTGFPGSGARLAPKKKRPKHQEIGRLEITIAGGQTVAVKIRLNKKARKALAKQGRIKSQLTVSQRQPDGTLKVIQTKKITFKAKKKP